MAVQEISPTAEPFLKMKTEPQITFVHSISVTSPLSLNRCVTRAASQGRIDVRVKSLQDDIHAATAQQPQAQEIEQTPKLKALLRKLRKESR